jgi:Histidine-specific methyltransferase, SAM-dependent
MILTTEALSGDPQGALTRQLGTAANHGQTIWLDIPSNLYLIEKQADAYLDLMARSYGDGFHARIRNLIARHSEDLLAGLHPRIDLIDLGPGYPDKSFPLLECMRRRNTAGRYLPIDISRRFLDVAAAACRPFGFPIEPHHTLLEELPEELRRLPTCARRLVMMGVTFMNYAPGQVLLLLSRMLRRGDAAIIAGELHSGDCVAALTGPYESEPAKAFNFFPLELAGVPQDHLSYFVRFIRGRIEMGFTILRPVRIGETSIAAGREIVTSISYRYRYQDLLSTLNRRFSIVQPFCDEQGRCAVIRISSSEQESFSPSLPLRPLHSALPGAGEPRTPA